MNKRIKRRLKNFKYRQKFWGRKKKEKQNRKRRELMFKNEENSNLDN